MLKKVCFYLIIVIQVIAELVGVVRLLNTGMLPGLYMLLFIAASLLVLTLTVWLIFSARQSKNLVGQ